MAIHQSFNLSKIPSLIVIRLLSLMLLICGAIATPLAMAASCQDIFTDPASGNHPNALTPPIDLVSKGNVQCDKGGCTPYFPDSFKPGDYKYSTGHFSHLKTIFTDGKTTRLYFDSLHLDNADINPEIEHQRLDGDEHDLIIYVAGTLTMRNHSHINGIVYVAGTVDMDASSSIEGGLASGGALTPTIKNQIDVELDDINEADFGNLCHSSWETQQPFHIQYGQASSSTIRFKQAFPIGVKPLVFLMPTINSQTPLATTPATAILTDVTRTGFTWQALAAPPYSYSTVTMNNVDWIAISPGDHQLANGLEMMAGVVTTNKVTVGKSLNYKNTPIPSKLSVVLNQIQSSGREYQNRCWLTSYSAKSQYKAVLGIDASQAYRYYSSQPACLPSATPFNQLAPRDIAYLAVAPGHGSTVFNGSNVRYQFAAATTLNRQSGNLQQQCDTTTDFVPNWFSEAPILVAGKDSRYGHDGGWLRRCKLSNANVSMVVDEDQNKDNERKHTQESYGYIALQTVDKVKPEQCLVDDFSGQSMDKNWIAQHRQGSMIPQIDQSNHLMLVTDNRRNQSASITYKHKFRGKGNLITVSFDYYAWSAWTKDGADGMALVFSDADVPPAPGGFGASLGYANSESVEGFHGGWLGIGFDEYGNFSEKAFGRDTGINSPSQSIGIRGAESTRYAYITNSAKLSPPLSETNGTDTPGRGDRYIVTLDTRQTNATYVTVQRKVKGSAITETVIPRFRLTGQPPLPENFYISLTGSTGMFYNNHAIGDFEACALDSEPIGEQVDHFEFDYSGSPLSCAPLAVTVKACKNATCSVLFDAPVIATLKNPNAGTATWLDSNMRPLPQSKLTINHGQERVYLQQFSSWQSTELEVAHSVPSAVPYSQTVCKNNGQIGSCQLRFADAGFVISDIKTYANKPANFSIKAVRKADNSLQCVPTFGGQTKQLNLSVDYITPRFKANPQNLLLSQTGAQYTQINTAAYLSVKFDNMGIAHFTMKYADAGKLSLLANYRGSDKTHDAGLVMNSTNGNIYSVPFGFCVKPSDKNAVCKNNPALCDVYKRTGDEFPLAVSARAWSSAPGADICDNIVTPSFEMDNILLQHSLLAPTVRDGGVLGELGTTSINIQQGLSTKVNQTVSEVGVFDFSAQTASHQTYLNAGLPINAGITQAIGRFVPSAFEITDYSLTPACVSYPDKPFSYMGQPFYTRFLVKALNQHSDVTRNYFAGFAKASAGWVADDYLVGHELGNRVDELPTLNWHRGIAEIDSHTIFHRLQKPKPDGPYTEWELGVTLNDNDGEYTKLNNADMNSVHAGGCGSDGVTCTAKRLGMQQMLFGRVVMDNVYGPETTTLRMPITAQYWDGNHWQINQLDSCTVIDNTHLLGDGEDLYSPAIVAGQSVTREGSPSLSHFQQGKFELLWQDQLNDALPVDKQYYHGEIIAPLAVPDYLKYYWQWETGIPVINSNPRASADFGLYRGNDRIIYWKEV